MAERTISTGFFANEILARLSPDSAQALGRHLQPVKLEVKQMINQPNEEIRYAYFPEAGMISIVSVMEDGKSIEVATIGREGMLGATVLQGIDSIPYQSYVQIAGYGHRLEVALLKKEAERYADLRERVLRYQAVSLTQTMQALACNGLHSVQQRCCRWLLMSRDRSTTDIVPLTHEFLALMLGVRRASVTDVLRPLQESGWIQSVRGEISILDRKGLESGSCECYRIITELYKKSLH